MISADAIGAALGQVPRPRDRETTIKIKPERNGVKGDALTQFCQDLYDRLQREFQVQLWRSTHAKAGRKATKPIARDNVTRRMGASSERIAHLSWCEGCVVGHRWCGVRPIDGQSIHRQLYPRR